MANIYMYAHGGSGNHGCEAIVRSTIKLLQGHSFSLISTNPEEDKFYGLDKLCNLIKEREEVIPKGCFDFFKAYAALKLRKDWLPLEMLHYKKAFDSIKNGDIALSIGGDNYCYEDASRYTMFHKMAKKRGAKTVLWGCSVEPSAIEQPAIAKDLANYDLITARETISYEALKKVNPNTVLVCDTAFLLEVRPSALPDDFLEGNTIGINLSPMVMKKESKAGMALANYEALIGHIIKSTDASIALIPHVVWNDTDDREAMESLYKKFANTGRVCKVTDRTCEELKYVISKCSFFVGARTHATIAAYSTCVPTLVVGYSVKARGIARDLFDDENGYVLPVQELTKPEELTNSFIRLYDKNDEIQRHLVDIIPSYKAQSSKANEALSKLC